jgi:P27 family predicted phage terminase small subunit
MKGAKPKPNNVIPMKGDATKPVPEPLYFLSDEGKEVWKRLAPEMVMLDRLKPQYHDLFAAYCEAAADLMRFTIQLVDGRYNYTAKTRNGIQEKKSAAWGQRQEAIANLRQIGALFGMSPVDEQRLSDGGQGSLLDELTRAVRGGPA